MIIRSEYFLAFKSERYLVVPDENDATETWTLDGSFSFPFLALHQRAKCKSAGIQEIPALVYF